MSLEDDLFRIEEGFWSAGKEHFLLHVDDNCLLAFPQGGQMHGIYSVEHIAETATAPNRWSDLKIANRSMLQPTDGIAVLSYQADVSRADGQPYSALVSSGYINRGEGWKLMFHQHSPL
jgi:hypothetical protein